MKNLRQLFFEIEKHKVMTGHASLIEAAKNDASNLEKALREAVDWLEHAPFDYSNGVEAFGQDEGSYYGWKAHMEMVNRFKKLLGIPVSDVEQYVDDMNKLPDDDFPF